METDHCIIEKSQINRYVVLCSNTKAQLSPTTNDVTTINKSELRLKLRPSLEMKKRLTWSKEFDNVRPSTLPTRFHNYRYDTVNNMQTHQETSIRTQFEKTKRYRSAPDITACALPKSSQYLPTRPWKFSGNAKLLSRKSESPREDDLSKSSKDTKENILKSSVSEFLAKPNPDKPPTSLRVHKVSRIKVEKTAVLKKHGNTKEIEGDNKNAINPSTAPSINMFANQPWYYQEKASWRYLRIKEPHPLPIESIFKKP